jgi:hypothetical protein
VLNVALLKPESGCSGPPPLPEQRCRKQLRL